MVGNLLYGCPCLFDMFQHRELGLIQSYQIGATIILTVLFWAYYLVMDLFVPGITLTGAADYFEYYLAITLAFQISFLLSKQNDVLSVSSGILESHRLIWPHILATLAISCMFLILTKDSAISRLFLFTVIPLIYIVLLIFTRFFALDILRFMLRHQRQKLLLVGQPSEVNNVRSLLAKAELFGFETVGMISDAPQEAFPPGIKRLGGPDDLEEVLTQYKVGNIFILGSPRDRRMLGGWMRLAEAHGCRVSLVNDLDIFLQRRLSYFRCDNIDLIELRDEPLQNLVNRFVKRVFDVVVSLPVVCLILPPLMLLVWLLQRFQAPGPLFFRQSRSGLDNQPFGILKFRTMYADQCDSAKQVTAGDDRVFPGGRFLRRFSLDEFPQFFNVLLGQMSMVGPRPHMTQHDIIFADVMSTYPLRGFVKPGITGLAQIRGFRGETATREDVIRRVECDIEYVESWSLLLDLRIIWQTALQVVHPPRTAY